MAPALIALLGAAASAPAYTPPEVARLVLNREIDGAPANVVLCIKVDGHDPTAEMLAALHRKDRTIVAASECRYVKDVERGSYHIKTKRPAHFLSVSDPEWQSPTALQVQALESYHGLWARHWIVGLVSVDGKWQITTFHEDWEA